MDRTRADDPGYPEPCRIVRWAAASDPFERVQVTEHEWRLLRTVKREREMGDARPASVTFWDIFFCSRCLRQAERQASQPAIWVTA